MAKIPLIRIDRTMFMVALNKRGLDWKTASERLGHSRKFLWQCYSQGYLTQATAVALKNVLGIELDEYKFEEPEPVKIEPVAEESVTETAVTAAIEIDYDKLYNLMFTAIYSAIKKFWSE